jgi:RNA polymerase sigma factor (sigma-70 family)
VDARPTPYAELERMSDVELVAHARARRPQGGAGLETAKLCVALVFERHRALVRAHCGAKAAPGDVDDLAQQVYVRFVRAVYQQTAPMVNPAGLLVKMTRNVVASHHERLRTDARSLDEAPEIAQLDDGYDEMEVAEAVDELLSVLDDRQRAVVVGKVFERLSAAEIGDRLGIKPGHVDVIFFHALKKLRQVVER